MSKFSMKASDKISGGGESSVDFTGYNEHILEVIGTKPKSRVAVLSGIIDLGVQPRPDYVEEYTGTSDQNAKIESGRSYLSEDEKEIVTELKPINQVLFMVDFPELQVNYGKFFGPKEDGEEYGEDDFKPYREIVNGDWFDQGLKKKLAKGVSLSCKKDKNLGWIYDGKTTIHKLATSITFPDMEEDDELEGVENGVVSQDFEIGQMLGGFFSMDVSAKKTESKGNVYINVKITNISSKHQAIPFPEYELEPFGIMMNEENDAESLKQIRSSVRNTLEQSLDWANSKLKQQLEALKPSSNAEPKGSEDDEPEEEKEAPKKPSKLVEKKPAGAKKNPFGKKPTK